jgi:hypothetical protein
VESKSVGCVTEMALHVGEARVSYQTKRCRNPQLHDVSPHCRESALSRGRDIQEVFPAMGHQHRKRGALGPNFWALISQSSLRYSLYGRGPIPYPPLGLAVHCPPGHLEPRLRMHGALSSCPNTPHSVDTQTDLLPFITFHARHSNLLHDI